MARLLDHAKVAAKNPDRLDTLWPWLRWVPNLRVFRKLAVLYRHHIPPFDERIFHGRWLRQSAMRWRHRHHTAHFGLAFRSLRMTNSATARAKTGACCAQVTLLGTSTLTNFGEILWIIFSGDDIRPRLFVLLLEGAQRRKWPGKNGQHIWRDGFASLKARGLPTARCDKKIVHRTIYSGALLCMNLSFRFLDCSRRRK